jgi:hypothetical protein
MPTRRTVPDAEFTRPGYLPGDIYHLVLFAYKPSVTPAQRQAIITRFLTMIDRCLRDKKPYIVSIDSGLPNGFEGQEKGFEQAFVVRFRSEGDRNFYVGTPRVTHPDYYDPVHHQFKDFVGPLLGNVLVYDFRAGSQEPIVPIPEPIPRSR